MWLLDIILPKFCAGCLSPGSYLCTDCQGQITQKPLICPICFGASINGSTHPLCQKPLGLDGLWSLASYDYPIRDLIKKFKYRLTRQVSQTLLNLLLEYWARYPTALVALLAKRPTDWQIVPVPLHQTRQNWRGFNQSQLIAQLIAIKLNVSLNDCLLRIRNTTPQFKLSRAYRSPNIKDAFALSMNYEHLTPNIILVDDVWTTGATLKECTKLLKRRGVKQVWALTIAR